MMSERERGKGTDRENERKGTVGEREKQRQQTRERRQ